MRKLAFIDLLTRMKPYGELARHQRALSNLPPNFPRSTSCIHYLHPDSSPFSSTSISPSPKASPYPPQQSTSSREHPATAAPPSRTPLSQTSTTIAPATPPLLALRRCILMGLPRGVLVCIPSRDGFVSALCTLLPTVIPSTMRV